MKRILSITALALLLASTLSGCLFKSAEELYSLPELSEDYTNLQDEIESLVTSGLEYAGPKSGDNTQAIQFQDLDGDGEDEVLAFFQEENSSDTKPLHIYIYSKTEEDLYESVAEIDGEGSSFHSIEYVDLDGSGTLELVVNYQISDGVYSLCAYSIEDYTVTTLMQSSCSSYVVTDLDEDEIYEIILLQQDSTGETGDRAEWYLNSGDSMSLEGSASLSSDIVTINRARSSKLADGEPAVYVTSTWGEEEEQLITDIFALQDGVLTNLTLEEDSGISSSTLREDSEGEIFATDINEDGIYEIPLATELGTSDIWQVDWMQYCLDGTAEKICTTLCAPEIGDGWYLELPDTFWDSFSDSLGISKEQLASGEEIVVTLYDCSDTGSESEGSEDTTYIELLSIYTITGDNRETRADFTGRYTLYEGSDTIYAFSLETDSGLTQAQIEDGFHFMPISWSE